MAELTKKEIETQSSCSEVLEIARELVRQNATYRKDNPNDNAGHLTLLEAYKLAVGIQRNLYKKYYS